MNKKYLLPALDSDEIVNAEGCWQNVPDAYDFLLTHLKPEYESLNSVFDGGTSAIPHMFEQVLLFDKAFFDKDDPNHQRALAEWEAIFVIIALKRIKNIDLKLIKIDLTTGEEGTFLSAACRMKPHLKPVVDNTTWDFLYILILKDEPIALFTPRTLVCPAKEFKKKIAVLSEWMQILKVNGKEFLKLKQSKKGTEQRDIAKWLTKLDTTIRPAYICGDSVETVSDYDCLQKCLDEIRGHYPIVTQGDDSSKLQDGMFPAINNNIRQEYSFLNTYCDFAVPDVRIRFLVDKLPEDIFSEKILLLQDTAEAIVLQTRENGEKLNDMVNQIAQLDGKMLLNMRGDGKETLPVFALLPLKETFVNELVQHDLSIEDVLEEYDICYHRQDDTLELVMTIQNFPYSFTRTYKTDDRMVICAREIPEIFVWPPREMERIGWKTYYLYTSQGKTLAAANSTAGRNKKEYTYCRAGVSRNPEQGFKITLVDQFPQYIQLTKQGVSGYLPVRRESGYILGEQGMTSIIYADIGCTTSYLTIRNVQKTQENSREDDEIQTIELKQPEAMWILKQSERRTDADCHFALPSSTARMPAGERHYFKNILNRRKQYSVQPQEQGLEPFVDGYVPFYNAYIPNLTQNDELSMLKMRYKGLHEEQRREIRIFLEQIFLYALKDASEAGGEYFKLRYLHSEQARSSSAFGELNNLMETAFQDALKRAGIKNTGTLFVESMEASRALAYSVLKSAIQRGGKDKLEEAMEERIHIGADIGLEKTIVSVWVPVDDAGKTYGYQYIEIPFGGRNISFLDDDNQFPQYQNMLSVFLSEPYEMGRGTENEKLLKKFSQGFSGTDKEYYKQLFDIIAMKIEKDGFHISPDIYNLKEEFRIFLQMMTYNFYLLLLQIGILVGLCYRDKLRNEKKATVYLSGNGAKFLFWILNYKKFKAEITKDNCKEMFIVPIKKTILEIMGEASGLVLEKNESAPVSIDYTVKIAQNPKTNLLNGYIYFEHEANSAICSLSSKAIDSSKPAILQGDLEKTLKEIYEDIFRKERGASTQMSNTDKTFDEIKEEIKKNSQDVCKNHIEEIASINETAG